MSIWFRLLMCWKNPKMTVQKSVADEYEHFASSRNPTSPTSSGLRTRRIGQMKPRSAFSASP
ncbi:hypothetical protein [Alistipes shahii]|uniref:hypothetical protein n=1 Tax=Alistipes shahii TaxID=328814 RepID=UPI00241EC4AD|nr:hypothetical protein [Alistipes shahii]